MMEYISVGVVLKPSTDQIVNVSHSGQEFQLTSIEAEVWLDGRFGFAESEDPVRKRTMRHLESLGLILLVTDMEHGRYWALTRCVICPANKRFLFAGLTPQEKKLLLWITKAGLRLSMAELVFLEDRGVEPDSLLLSDENRQALVEKIYTSETIYDNILENEMSHAAVCDRTVERVLRLLAKKRIVLL